uniref:SAWADEE domain-containing protein n=1 Tax=Opuntia streptacantha TaxID=393608 RepID=A0A7C9D2Q7_OPUST
MEATMEEVIETPSIFAGSEISEMENLFRELGKDSLNQEFCQELAATFSSSTCRVGKPAISWEQVQGWFQDKQKDLQASADNCVSRPDSSVVLKGKTSADFSELAFEAKSARDNAWYDVGTFLNYRFLSTGELEARVRFAGFGNSHDEWVNVREGVRERSIPLEASECHKVKVGDLVLCYQERPDYAVYTDAHVLEIQRRLHDIKGCRCIFVVRFDEDKTVEKLPLNKICCRP